MDKIYIDLQGVEKEYTSKDSISLADRVLFINEVAEVLVSDSLGFLPVLERSIFDRCIVKYYTDIPTAGLVQLENLEKFLKVNASVVEDLKKNIQAAEYKDLQRACKEAIKFRKQNYSILVKPDGFNLLLEELVQMVKKFSDRTIDEEAVTKMAEIIPFLKDMGKDEVAKAIIKEQKR